MNRGTRPIDDLLLTYYGDDFTGSTDVLESLHSGGIEAVLFMTPPSQAMLSRYAHVRAFGIAGNSRAMSPTEMDQTLPEIFSSLREFAPKIVQYKVCSTFDSSPTIGSIGRAIDIGHRVFRNRSIPMAIGSPKLGRYSVFGNLFARSGLDSDIFRLDRHATMQCHPVTPMTEADLRLHLSRQTSRHVELIDVLSLVRGDDAVCDQIDRIQADGSVVMFDTLTENHLETVGHAICEMQRREQNPLFVVGSSGVDCALVKHWQSAGILSSSRPLATPIASVDRTIILSGSCSPVTDRQIRWAIEHGFADVPVDTLRLQDRMQAKAETGIIVRRATAAIGRGQSVIIHTSRGPADPRTAVTKRSLEHSANGDTTLGAMLGNILRAILEVCPIRRVAVVGGDTAGQVARSLGIEAVEMLGPLEPGAPLCIVRSRENCVDGLEITFKGGQVGYDEFFGSLLSGRHAHKLVGATQ